MLSEISELYCLANRYIIGFLLARLCAESSWDVGGIVAGLLYEKALMVMQPIRRILLKVGKRGGDFAVGTDFFGAFFNSLSDFFYETRELVDCKVFQGRVWASILAVDGSLY